MKSCPTFPELKLKKTWMARLRLDKVSMNPQNCLRKTRQAHLQERNDDDDDDDDSLVYSKTCLNDHSQKCQKMVYKTNYH